MGLIDNIPEEQHGIFLRSMLKTSTEDDTSHVITSGSDTLELLDGIKSSLANVLMYDRKTFDLEKEYDRQALSTYKEETQESGPSTNSTGGQQGGSNVLRNNRTSSTTGGLSISPAMMGLMGVGLGIGAVASNLFGSSSASAATSATPTANSTVPQSSVSTDAATANIPGLNPDASRTTAPEQIEGESFSDKFANYLGTAISVVTNPLSFLGNVASSVVNGVAEVGTSVAAGMTEGWNNIEGVGGNEASAQAMNYFMSQGWSRMHAAAIVGNLQVESGNFDPDVISGETRGDGGHAVGVAQWNNQYSPERVRNFQQFAGRPLRGAPLQRQLEYIQWELTNTESSAAARLRASTTVEDAAAIVDRYYERSDRSAVNQRIANARTLLGGNDGATASNIGRAVGSSGSFLSGAMQSGLNLVNTALGGSGGGFRPPTGNQRITSRFGMRTLNGNTRMHRGVDLGPVTRGRSGDAVMASAPGVVSFAGQMNGYGNIVIIRHANNMETRYAHLHAFRVRQGATVASGQLIATMGNTGHGTGVHLHFEIRRGGTAVDPLTLLGSGTADENARETEPGFEPAASRPNPLLAAASSSNIEARSASRRPAPRTPPRISTNNNPLLTAAGIVNGGNVGGPTNARSEYRLHLR